MGEKSPLGFREGVLILEINGDTDLVEFLGSHSQMEREEISQSGILLQIDAFTTLFANEPGDIGQIATGRFNGVMTVK